MKWYVVLLIAGALCLSVAANPALSGQSASADLFKAMDKDGNGTVTVEEYLAVCKQDEKKCKEEFKWFDRDKNGGISLNEYEGKVKQ